MAYRDDTQVREGVLPMCALAQSFTIHGSTFAPNSSACIDSKHCVVFVTPHHVVLNHPLTMAPTAVGG